MVYNVDMKTKMPDTIYLFPTFFKIVDVTRGESAKYKGVAKYSDREIGIEPAIHEEDKKSVMIHEIVHCILNSAGFENHDEIMLDVLANGFLSIIRGNKDLIRWLEEIK